MAPDFTQVDLMTLFRPGMRVVVRHRVADQATDALGPVVCVSAVAVTVRTRRHGDVRISRDLIVAAKPVPPAPARRGRPHLAIGIGDLQELMVAGMPPLESRWLGRWLLRAASDARRRTHAEAGARRSRDPAEAEFEESEVREGYTGRANSVLPLGDPGVPLDAAVTEAEQWYAERRQPALVQLFGPSGFDPATDALGGFLLARGWRILQRTLVMTADADVVAASGPASAGAGLCVEVTERPTAGWWAGVGERGRQHQATFAAVLDRVDRGLYVTVTAHDRTQAVGRGALGAGWAGIFEVQVHPGARRQGLGRLVVAATAARARAHSIRLLYLQVTADNEAAVSLYRSMGFTVHHEYYYARGGPA